MGNFRRQPLATVASAKNTMTATFKQLQHYHATVATKNTDRENSNKEKKTNQWLTLPAFTLTVDGSSIGKELYGQPSDTKARTITNNMTAVKWILKCCPQLPRSLVHKLFRLRQVRKEYVAEETKSCQLRRVRAKELMDIGDRIFLPTTVDVKTSSTKPENENLCNEEMKVIRGLELYKDPAIIVINKPPGMPVQGGIGIKRSLDELAAKYLRYNYTESPRLVHRLDRDSTGILVMGRTLLSATILHSIFREKTFGASDDVLESKRSLQKRYWALVIGSPRRAEGLISVPLGKVVYDGKSEKITVVDKSHTSAQHAVTEYQVIASSSCGYTWLELSPLTGRKHQLRVHCAEVLGTPIVGDYKYGWQAHKNSKHILINSDRKLDEKICKGKPDPFGLNLENGSISDKHFHLHLHCKQMLLPNIAQVLQRDNPDSEFDPKTVETITLDAALPPHMQRSWDLLN
ncbi:RNA pseudouridine synthase 4 [Forsythia ovata]|uniref:RNA pseudouridine synthase 4 n=1 Tax=Forsythia ovata TaxID=205694 RepID=A0ABD1Q958_9LAMI